MRKLAIAVCLAIVGMCAAPCTAAPPSHDFSASAKSVELRPAAVVAHVESPDFVALAADDATGGERAPVRPVMYAATLIVGFGYAAAPGAPASFDPGRRNIA